MKCHPKHLPARERRAGTVAAVLALAAEQNPDGITTAAIAGRMNLSQGALFRHFPNKEALWLTVMEWVADQLLTRVERAANESNSPGAALEAMFMTHIDFIIEHPGVPRILFSELQHAGETPAKITVHTLLRQYGERLRQIIQLGQSQGELSPDIDPVAAASLYIGTIQGLLMQAMIIGDVERMRRNAPGALALYRRAVWRRT
jgi:AcrR family transcriptional regulator